MRIAVTWILIGLVVAECVARWGLGLGDPPLTVIDPQVGYMFAPNQDVMRFGNHVMYNAFSMRSDCFPPHKSSQDELRVMMIGDSVVNGGGLTDQKDVASERLKRRLREKLGRQVIVGNISAGGWSPSNELNYVKRFGLFDADVVVIVASSHDARGDEGFGPLSVDFPMRCPPLALSEVFERYLPRYLPKYGEKQSTPGSGASIPDDTMPLDTDDLKQLIAAAHQAGAEVVVALHPNVKEFAGEWEEGHGLMRQAAEEAGVEMLIELKPHYQQASQKGVTMYRDVFIHLSPAGQGVLADVLEPVVLEKLRLRVNRLASGTPTKTEGGGN